MWQTPNQKLSPNTRNGSDFDHPQGLVYHNQPQFFFMLGHGDFPMNWIYQIDKQNGGVHYTYPILRHT